MMLSQACCDHYHDDGGGRADEESRSTLKGPLSQQVGAYSGSSWLSSSVPTGGSVSSSVN